MNRVKRVSLAISLPAAVLLGIMPRIAAQNAPAQRRIYTTGSQGPLPEHAKFTAAQAEAGGTLFLQHCAFCHGKDAAGGETGPDLTRSNLVRGDKNGEAIGVVVRDGRLNKGMPRFSLSDTEVADLVAFIHKQQDDALSQSGNRRGVDEADLHTGSVEAGKKYFEGPGGCAKCHSASGDLAGIASRYSGLRLMQQMLYPRDSKFKVTVETPSGQTSTGTLVYQDEFVIGMIDSTGTYHSWRTNAVKFQIDKSLEAHVEAMSKYTDDDMHNVLAYIQTLK